MNKEILREIGKIYRALNSFSDFLMKSINLEKGQYQFLIRVKENPGINQQDLSAILLVDKTTTAKAVNKLVLKDKIQLNINYDFTFFIRLVGSILFILISIGFKSVIVDNLSLVA